MSERFFLDTNILVYADAADVEDKQRIALEWLNRAFAAQGGVVSTQVLQEYFAVATRKMGIPTDNARRRVVQVARLPVVQVDPAMIVDAIDAVGSYHISFWDALILAAARSVGCDIIVSEDGPNGHSLAGVRYVNPFAP